ncbi:MAG TPA: MarR family winged helix-turn-helix transcriptional regulator [Planctomycetaceae bacterium]|nr:MarR family winged helix-turn-helix transcriptional regulator [Planctomycetaceae bacterium]
MAERGRDVERSKTGGEPADERPMELSTEEKIIVAIRQITHAVDLWSRQLWQQAGLTSPQLAVLKEIESGRSATPTAIAEGLHLTQPTVSGILQRLERIGAIEREPSAADGRSVLAVVTPKGRSLIAQCPSLLRDRVRDRLAELPDAKRARLLDDVRLLAEIMGAADVEEAPFFFSRNARKSRMKAEKPETAGRR